MCWRNDVQWSIHQDDDPRKFMTVSSGEYVLAIPDYSHQANRAMEAVDRDGERSVSSSSSTEDSAIFKKVVMKLSGNVRWLAGLVFERNVNGGGRSFDFRPHYDIMLKNVRHSKNAVRQVRSSSIYRRRLMNCRAMMRFKASEVTTYICRSQSLLR